MSVGLLILRLVVGALFFGHGSQTVFGWFGGHGVDGTGGFFESLRYRNGREMALVAGLAEAGGGTLLALGFLTWLGAAAILGVMLNAMVSVHIRKGMWSSNGGAELALVFSAAAVSLAFTGPGRYSIDRAIGWRDTGWVWGLVAILVGVGSAALVLSMRRPPTPATEEQPGQAA